MKVIAALPVLIAFLVGALPAHAWTWPVSGPVLQPFNFGDDPFAAGQHRGLDVGAPPGTTVVAPAGGAISFAGTIPRSGRTVTIATGGGYSVTLVHLASYSVVRGAPVAEGEPVGTVGPSGEPEHPRGYVHLGVRVTANEHGYVDPAALLPAAPTGDGGQGSSEGGGESPVEAAPDPSEEGQQPRGGETGSSSPAEGEAGQELSPTEAEHVPPATAKGDPDPEVREGTNLGRFQESRPGSATGGKHVPETGAVAMRAAEPGPGASLSIPERSTASDPESPGSNALPTKPPGASVQAGETTAWGSPIAAPPPTPVGRRHESPGARVGAGVAVGAAALLGLVAAAMASRRPQRPARHPDESPRLRAPVGDAASTEESLMDDSRSAVGAELDAWLESVLGPRSACAVSRACPRRPRAAEQRGRARAGGAATRSTAGRGLAGRSARGG